MWNNCGNSAVRRQRGVEVDEPLRDVVAVADHCRLMYELSCIVMHLMSDPLYAKSDAAADLSAIVEEMGQEVPEMPSREEVAAAVESTESMLAEEER